MLSESEDSSESGTTVNLLEDTAEKDENSANKCPMDSSKMFSSADTEGAQSTGHFLDEIVSVAGKNVDSRIAQERIKIISVGYVDTQPEELGAVPMKGKNRHEWKKIQQVTFTNWVNDRISSVKGGPQVGDLQRDFQSGVLLIYLLESLTNKRISGVVREPEVTAQKLANLDLAFGFMQKEKIKMIGIG